MYKKSVIYPASWYDATTIPYTIRAIMGKITSSQGSSRPNTRVGQMARIPMMVAALLRKVFSLLSMALHF